ncbi:unnamed protein product (macronuclear) [Paramecium tetraurelia]|uniref:NADH-cytochrome b5 reductase n=1 Tax=Paramecium tetraurelia TaxID=5888 RepID=A0BZ91_PARTE|nr:uncharacterized protein GSPATT00033711001 [Paramecium tetraurelia]CAK63858.1 unnamed protein product [Paramecium tetraurelia]|eukprot:XP_001431256.1 hypothetical protein (macronuclear) [Paramecium tetraurelia strain d4-2]
MIFFVILVSLLLLILVLILWANYNQSNNFSAQEQSQKIEEQTCQLIEKTKLNHDTYKLKFALPSKINDLGIKVGQYISLHHPNKYELNNMYFPINPIDQKGKFELLVKIQSELEKDNQKGRELEKDNQKVSEFEKDNQKGSKIEKDDQNGSEFEKDNQNGSKIEKDDQNESKIKKDEQNRSSFNYWIEKMIPGDSALIKSPLGSFFYFGSGNTFRIQKPQRITAKYKRIMMIAGGSGIAPMYQIIQAVANNSSDKTQLQLLYANKTQQDILLYNELKAFEASKKIKLHLTLDKPLASWVQFSGFVSRSMIERAFGTIDKHTLVLVCGPPKMRQLVGQIFHELNVDSNNFYMFT